MCKMRKLRVSLIAIVMFLFCSVGFASAQTMMLEYDGEHTSIKERFMRLL